MNIFIIRNLKLFFRDKSAVLFSLLAVFIIIALYAVFLGDVWLPSTMDGLKNTEYLMNTWLVSGLLAVASVTTTMGAFGIMIDDKIKKTDKDFYSSPVKRGFLLRGYLGSAVLIGILLSLITFAAAEVYIVLSGGDWIKPLPGLKIVLVILLSTIANTSILCFIVSFFKSQRAFSTASTIIGTLIGFLTGIYLPIGNLPESVQTIIKLFPPSHAAALFRQTLMEAPIQDTFNGIGAQYVTDFNRYMGIQYSLDGQIISPTVSVLILIGTSVIFYGLSVWNLSRNSLKSQG